MKFITQLEKNKNVWMLLFILIFFFFLRLPSLFEPYWYGDEGMYQGVAMAIKDNRLLYKDIFDNKPPLIYMLYSAFNSDQFAVRGVSLIFGLLSVFIFFLLAKKIFGRTKDSKIYLFSTVVFALLSGLPLIEGNIANAENFMLLPILISAFLILSLFQTQSTYGIDKIKNQPFYKAWGKKSIRQSQIKTTTQNSKLITLLIAGFLLGIAFLFKVVAFFDFVAFLVFITIASLPQKLKISDIKQVLKQTVLFPIGLFFPIVLTVLFFILKGGFTDFLQAVLLHNIGYLKYGNTFIIPQGILVLKLILLCVFIFYIFKIRKMLSKTAIFVLVWFAFSLFNSFFAGRPYSHYLLVLAPSFSLMLGLIFWEQKHKKAIAIFVIASLLLVFNNFYFFQKTIPYYQNFTDFLANKKSVSAYQAFFDKQTAIDYEVASFLKSRIAKNDSIFVWGDNPQLYKMVNVIPPTKYIAAYHITNSPERLVNIIETVERIQPRFIVIISNPESLPLSLLNYSSGIRMSGVVIYERIF